MISYFLPFHLGFAAAVEPSDLIADIPLPFLATYLQDCEANWPTDPKKKIQKEFRFSFFKSWRREMISVNVFSHNQSFVECCLQIDPSGPGLRL